MTQWPKTDEALIRRVSDPEDASAWSDFLAIYRPVVVRMALGRGLQSADAEDLAQQVFVSISGAIGNWQPGPGKPPFRVWLTRIARNAIVNALARQKPDQGTGSTSVVQQLHAVVDARHETTQELIRASRLQAMRWAADQIREEFSVATWDMFWKTAIEGIAAAEVARQIGRSTSAVYMAKYYVTKRLKQKTIEVSHMWSTLE